MKINVAFGYLGFSPVLAGFLFKMMHWHTAHIQPGLGIIMLNPVYFPPVFLKMYRRSAGQPTVRRLRDGGGLRGTKGSNVISRCDMPATWNIPTKLEAHRLNTRCLSPFVKKAIKDQLFFNLLNYK